MAILFALTAIIGSIILDALFVGFLSIIVIMSFVVLFVPFAGTFLFRITGIDGLADGEYIDVYLADGWLHKFLAFFMINVIASGLAGLYFSIPDAVRTILGLSIALFLITVGLKIDNAKSDYDEKRTLFSDFLPTILGFGIACFSIFTFTAAPAVIGIILLCLATAVYVARNFLALTKW